MKNIIGTTVLGLVVGLAAVASAAIPPINVLVSDASGKAAYKGATNANGSFATDPLQPGNYVVQFASSSLPKGGRFILVVSAGAKKISADGIASEKLAGPGVAIKINVGAGLNISGQVVAQDKQNAPVGKNGKPMVWIPRKLGSNIAAHWAESDSAEAKDYMAQGGFSRKDIQERQNQGITPKQSGN